MQVRYVDHMAVPLAFKLQSLALYLWIACVCYFLIPSQLGHQLLITKKVVPEGKPS